MHTGKAIVLPILFLMVVLNFEWDYNHPNDNVQYYHIYSVDQDGQIALEITVSGTTNEAMVFFQGNPWLHYFFCTAEDDEGYTSDPSNKVSPYPYKENCTFSVEHR